MRAGKVTGSVPVTMKAVFIISLVVVISSATVLAISLFDVVRLDYVGHGIAGVVLVVAIYFLTKSYIRLRKSTRRYY